MAANNAYSIGQLIASLGLDDAEFQRGMQQAQTSMQATDAAMKRTSQQMAMSMDRIGKKMEHVGKKMTMMITVPLVAAGAGAFKMQKDFEAALSKITGLVGVSEEQVRSWEKAILAMAPAVGRGPKELADALFFVTSAGIKGAAAMDVLEMSAKASVAGLGETKVIADLVTSAMNAYGQENLNAAQATDILTAAVREGKAEASELAGAMGMVLPITSEMGVSFDQVGAAMAAMTRTGTNASIAATQLKAIMASLLRPTEQAEEALVQMGLSSAGLRKQMREEGLIQTLETLRKSTNQYGEEAMGKVFPNIRALMGVLDLMGANAEDNIKIFNSLTNATGSLDNAMNAASKTSQFKWDQAMAQLQSTSIAFGNVMKDLILPMINQFTSALSKAGDWLSDLDAQQKKNVVTFVALTAAAGPLVKVMGMLTRAVSANPYVALAAAVAVLAVALVQRTRQVWKTVDAEKELNKLQERISEEYNTQVASIESLVRIAKNEKISLDKRKEAVKELNRIMPDYNGYLDEETGLLKANDTALQSYVKTLRTKIQMRLVEEEYEATLRKIKKVQDDLIKQEEKLNEERGKAAPGYDDYKQYGGGMGVFRKAAVVDNTEQNLEALKGLRDELETEIANLSNLLTSPPEVETGTDKGKGKGKGKGAATVVVPEAEDTVFNKRVENLFQKRFALEQKLRKEPIDRIEAEIQAMVMEEDAFERVNEVINETVVRYNALTAASELWAESGMLVARTFDHIGEAVSRGNESIGRWISAIGDILGRSAELISVIKKVAAAKQLEAGANAIASASVIPFPANILAIGASVASVIAAFASLPALAEGGLAYGNTLAQVGEYSGARSNPEVIAPLSKLKSLLGDSTGMPREVILRAEGRDLVAVMDFNQKRNKIY